MGGALRIFQVGGLCLDDPAREDLTTLPKHLQSRVVQSRYRTAQKLFDEAISQNADLVLIAGPVTLTERESRPYWFLQQQLTRLAERGIAVVCAEVNDRFHWPSVVPFPSNLRVLNRSQAIGFRVGPRQENVEFGWLEIDADESLEPPSGLRVQLSETHGCIEAASYDTGIASAQLTVGAIQANGFGDMTSSPASVIEITADQEIDVKTCELADVYWMTISVDDTDQTSLVAQMTAELDRMARDSNNNSALTFVEFRIESRKAILDRNAPEAILRQIQRESSSRTEAVWPVRLTLQTSEAIDSTSEAVRQALWELEQLHPDDVYENLDLQVLELDERRLVSLKSIVARRLPQFLTPRVHA